MSVAHKAQALAIYCIDFRFQEMIEKDLEDRNLKGKVDKITIPGASMDLAAVMEHAKVSIRLHDPDEIIIYEHEDCGAYGEDNSQQTHRKNAQKLADKLKAVKPTLSVTTLIATFDGIKTL